MHNSISTIKKATNLSINNELLKQAKELNINLSKTLEEKLIELIHEKQAQQWLEENQSAIKAYNTRIESDGMFSDGVRKF